MQRIQYAQIAGLRCSVSPRSLKKFNSQFLTTAQRITLLNFKIIQQWQNSTPPFLSEDLSRHNYRFNIYQSHTNESFLLTSADEVLV